MIKNEFIRNRSLSFFFFFFFFLGWELVLIKKVDSVLYRPEFAVLVLRSEQKYGCFVPLQIPGRTGRFGKNTGYRPENENRPVKCKPTVKKKKDTQIPTVASTFLVATPLHQSSSISFLSLVLLLLLHLSSRVAPLLTD